MLLLPQTVRSQYPATAKKNKVQDNRKEALDGQIE